MRAMSRKKEKISAEEVSTERDGASQRWDSKGTAVSIVMGVVSVETWRRREEGRAAAVVDGLRKRLDRRESRDSAIFLRFGLESLFFF